MKNISTNELLQKLFKTTNVTRFIKNYGDETASAPFCVYLNRLCTEKKIMPKQVIKKSGIDRVYGYQIFDGAKNPSRDKIIQLAFGFGINYDETQELLKAACKSPLYIKIRRDAVIAYALNKGLSISDLQMTLEELNLPLLGKEEKYA